MTATTAQPHLRPPVSATVAAAETEIEQTRRRLDLAISSIRADLAMPIAAAAAAAAMLDRAGDTKQLGAFVKRNAAPLGLIALGAIWLAVKNRGALGEMSERYARELRDRARMIATKAVEAALSAAIDQIARPDTHAGSLGSSQPDAAKAQPSA
jgi:F0F1-type ATP synthase membrane subunit b/b'